MSQVADFSTANGSGLVVRSGINNVAEALASKNSGSVAPSDLVAFMNWFDTAGANPIWKVRNAANSGWIQLAEEISGNLRLSSDGAAIPSVGAANIFTADQKIRLAAALGQLLVGGQVTSGIAARLAMIGNNSGAAETIYAKLEADIESNAAGNESGRLLASLIRGGSQTEIGRLGDGVQIGSPTGGLKGLGTLNLAAELYLNNVDIADTIAAASNSAWQTVTFSGSPQDLDFANFRNFDLTIDTADVTLNFDNPSVQVGRWGEIRLNNTSGGDRTITFSNANSVEIGGGFTTDGPINVPTGEEKYLLFNVKSATLVHLFAFVGETVVSGNGFSSIVAFDLTSGQSADPLLRLQPISDGETQRVVLHEIQETDNLDRNLLIRAATAVAVLAPGSGTYQVSGDLGNGVPSDNGIRICDMISTSVRAFGTIHIRRTGGSLWVNGNTTSARLNAAFGLTHEISGGFGGDTFDQWVLDLDGSNNPATGSKYTVYRDIA